MSSSLPDHLDLIAAAPNGIQKLRGLILELAVRGKLVPQDPKDEPASELRKRIAQVRARLEVEGTCKKSNATPLDAGDAPPFELPAGWVLSQLSDLALVLNGRAYSKDELLSEGVPVLRVGNLFTSNHWYYSNLQLEADKYCDQGDLLYSWSASFGPFIWQGPKVIYHYHIWKLRLFDESSLSKEFFYKFLLEKTAEIKAAGHGVSMIHMTKEKMEKIFVPFPPLAEQHRIVAKVDELMALCDRLEAEQTDATSAHAKLVETLLGTLTQSTDAADIATNWQRLAEHFDTLFTTESSLDALKQTILQLAVMGKLVPQDPKDEPAHVSLTNAFNLRKGLVKSGVIPKRLLTESPQLSERPITVPENWAFASFDHLAAPVPNALKAGPFGSALKKDCYVPSGYKIYGQEQVIKQDAFYGDYYISEAKFAQLRSCEAKPGDLLISLVGTIGKVLVLPLEAEAGIINPRLIKMSLDLKLVYAEYVKIMLASPWVREFLFSESHGSTMDVLNLTILRNLPVPLPPLAEQHRIVAKVDELMALCDRLKADLAEARSRQTRLSTTLIESALQAA
ncbi:MAG: restriction endonuclease subunit S [Propionivibrio sp.]|nr:restriction endonuclease subunit S [Propionivibrio sp.]